MYIREQIRERDVPLANLISEASRLVPPGMAYRRYRSIYEASRVRNGSRPLAEWEMERIKDDLVANGQRHIVRGTLKGFKSTGRISIDDTGGRLVRLGPRPWPVDQAKQ